LTLKVVSFVAKSGIGKTTLVAVASDAKLELDVPVLDLNDPGAVADFIEEKFLI